MKDGWVPAGRPKVCPGEAPEETAPNNVQHRPAQTGVEYQGLEHTQCWVKLWLVSAFWLISCVTLLAGAEGEISLPSNSRYPNHLHEFKLPADHQHHQLFMHSVTPAHFCTSGGCSGSSRLLIRCYNIFISWCTHSCILLCKTLTAGFSSMNSNVLKILQHITLFRQHMNENKANEKCHISSA